MKSQKIIFRALILAAAVFISSCNKDKDNTTELVNASEGLVSIKIGNSSYANDSQPAFKSSALSLPFPQSTVVSLDENFDIQAILTPENELQGPSFRASASDPKNLTHGTQYQIAAYDTDGNYVSNSQVLTYTGESSNWNLSLTPGTYTFVAVGAAAEKTFPAINYKQKLSDITFTAIGGDTDILWQSQQAEVKAGENTPLTFVLKHLFTQVSVHIESTSEDVVGKITNLNEVEFSPIFEQATIKLADGSFTVQGNQKSIEVALAHQVDTLWSSAPVIVITDGNSSASHVKFGKVSLNKGNGEKSGSVDLSNLILNKGSRYTLKLRLLPKGAIDFPNSPIFWGSANAKVLNSGGKGLEEHQYLKGDVYDGKGSQGYCADAIGAAGWRIPNEKELEELIALGTVRDTFENQTGWFFGTEVVPTNKNNYLFLPDNDFIRSKSGNAGAKIPTDAVGAYWANEDEQGIEKEALIMTEKEVYIGYIHQNNEIGIRCVRSK